MMRHLLEGVTAAILAIAILFFVAAIASDADRVRQEYSETWLSK